jgi:hypothetical protein
VRSGGSLFGFEVEAEFAFERLLPVPGQRGRIEVLRAERELLDCHGELVSWLELEEPDGSTFALARTVDGMAAWCSVTGSYLFDPGARRVWGEPAAGARLDSFEHRVVASMLPLMLSMLGDLVVHAAALVIEGRAVLFCGESGSGKSTLALALAHQGHALVSEDGVALTFDGDSAVAWPGPLGVRMVDPRPDGVRKRTIFLPGEGHVYEPMPVGAVVVLGGRHGSGLELGELEPVAALPAIMPHTSFEAPEALSRAYALAAGLVRSAPVYRCTLPDDLAALPGAAAELALRLGDVERASRAA